MSLLCIRLHIIFTTIWFTYIWHIYVSSDHCWQQYGRILMKLRMDIPVHHAQCVWQKKIEQIQGQGHRKHENHYLSHNFWILVKIPIRSVGVPMTYDVPFLRHVTSNKTYDCCIFSNFVNSEPIDLKIGTHIDLTCTIYHIKNCTNKNNVTRTYFHGNQIPHYKA